MVKPLIVLTLLTTACATPDEDHAAGHSELAAVTEPCRTEDLMMEISGLYDTRGRCWVSFHGLKDDLPHSHPIKSKPEECPFACGRVGTFYWIHNPGEPDTTVGVIWLTP